jgi:hypothetical protein
MIFIYLVIYLFIYLDGSLNESYVWCFFGHPPFLLKEWVNISTASIDGVAKTPTTTYIQIVLCGCKMESCALCTPIKDDLGLLYLERLLWVHNKFGGMIAVQVQFFSLALHMDGYKEHGCQVHVEEAASPTKLGSFCLHWKENGIRIP